MRALLSLVPCAIALLTALPVAGQTTSAPVAPTRAGSGLPDGARFAYVDLDRVVAASTEGRAFTARLQDLRAKKGVEVDTRGKQVDALQARLGSDVLNDAARAQLQREFDRARVDFQRFSEDAQAELRQAQQQLQVAFGQRLFPVIGQIAKEKDLWAVFSADSPMLWHDPRLDISDEVARRIDANAPPAGAAVPPRDE
jgi:Skp family chaperone for outer membrane proteins